MQRLRKNDEVIVISGKDKGVRGTVERVLPARGSHEDRVLISGVNAYKKHTKPDPARQKPGGIENKTRAIRASKVALYDSERQVGGRIKFAVNDAGVKIRVFAASGKEVGSS